MRHADEGFPLRVIARDARGNPLAGFGIDVSQEGRPYRRLQTDVSGTTRLVVAPPDVLLSVSGPPMGERAYLRPDSQRVRADVGEVVFVVPDGAFVEGTVVDERGAPIADVELLATQKGLMPSQRHATGARGRFKLLVGPDEPVEIALTESLSYAASDGGQGSQPRGLVGGVSGVRPGSTDVTIRARFSDTRSLRLRVESPDGRPVVGSTIEWGGRHPPLATGEGGVVNVADLVAEAYALVAKPSPADAAVRAWLPSDVLQLMPEGQDVVPRSRGGVAIRATVFDGSVPAPEAAVEARRDGRLVAKGRTDARGTFVLVADPERDFPMTLTASAATGTLRGSVGLTAPPGSAVTVQLTDR